MSYRRTSAYEKGDQRDSGYANNICWPRGISMISTAPGVGGLALAFQMRRVVTQSRAVAFGCNKNYGNPSLFRGAPAISDTINMSR